MFHCFLQLFDGAYVSWARCIGFVALSATKVNLRLQRVSLQDTVNEVFGAILRIETEDNKVDCLHESLFLKANRSRTTSNDQNHKQSIVRSIIKYRSCLCQRFRERKNESLPRLLTHLQRTVYRDAKLHFYMRVVTLKGPITKPVEIQINR